MVSGDGCGDLWSGDACGEEGGCDGFEVGRQVKIWVFGIFGYFCTSETRPNDSNLLSFMELRESDRVGLGSRNFFVVGYNLII